MIFHTLAHIWTKKIKFLDHKHASCLQTENYLFLTLNIRNPNGMDILSKRSVPFLTLEIAITPTFDLFRVTLSFWKRFRHRSEIVHERSTRNQIETVDERRQRFWTEWWRKRFKDEGTTDIKFAFDERHMSL